MKLLRFIFKYTLFVFWFFSLFLVCKAANDDYIGKDLCNNGDIMQQAFCTSKRNQTVLDMGNTKTAVWQSVMGGWVEINIDPGKDKEERVQIKQPLVVKIAKILLMLTIVLSVTMIIVNGIQYIIKSGNGEDPADARKNLIYIVVGIILALLSAVLVTLFRSVGESTLQQVGTPENIIDQKK